VDDWHKVVACQKWLETLKRDTGTLFGWTEVEGFIYMHVGELPGRQAAFEAQMRRLSFYLALGGAEAQW
jgi:hypothetical protein